jgi:ABC-type molybdate transport system substrate-binding protein
MLPGKTWVQPGNELRERVLLLMSVPHRVFFPKRRLGRLALVAGVLLVVTGALGTALVVGGFLPGQCRSELTLPVTVAAAIEPVAQQVAADFQRDHPTVGGRCVKTQITVGNSAEVASELPGSPVVPPALWIPDSTMWALRAQRDASTAGPDAPRLDVKAPLAMPPLVVAAPLRAAPGLGYPDSPLGWQRVLDGSASVAIGNPTATTEGLATLLAGASVFSNPDGTPRPEMTAALLRVSRTALPTINQAFTKVQQDTAAPPFTATEQAVVAFNRASSKRDLVAVYPAGGTIALDLPVVRVVRHNEDPGMSAAADAFEKALRSGSAAAYFADAGFRDPQGNAPANWFQWDGVRSQPPSLLRAPSIDQVMELLRAWSALSLEARMLTMIDISSAMKTATPGGGTRIDLARDVALTALGSLPDGTNVGLWAFSSRLTNDHPYTSLVPIGPLAEPLRPDATRRQTLQTSLATLPSRVRGPSALYAATLGAFRAVRQNYDPKKVNSVVLITNGRNDDSTGMNLQSLLAALRAEADPAQPVLIVPVAVSPDADMDALNQIASVSGGKAYQAKQPADIRNVLFDALSQRKCRPRC